MREYHVFSAMAQASEAPRNLGRRISRRLSMSVAKVPTFIQSRFSRTDADVVDFNTNGAGGGGGGGTGQSSAVGGGGSLVSHNGLKWPQQLRRSRPVTVHILLPNGIERTITCPGKSSVRQAVQPVALELHICDFRLRMSDTLAVVSPSAEASLLDGDIVLLEDTTRVRDERGETDGRFRLTEDLLEAEREFLVNLRTIHDVYERPLRKLCSISDEEKRLLFGGVEPILSVSNMLLTKLADALSSWDPHETKIGSLFSKQFWNQFDEYYRFFTQAKELLKEKQSRDDEFAEICKLRQGAALHTIDSLLDLPIQRLASYERYFQDLLSETAADHPDLDEVHKARDKAQELLKRCEEEINQLDRVQNLFPNDQLYLHDKDAVSLKMKGLIRKRSTTAARLQRAFSAKSLRTAPTTPLAAASSNGNCEVDASCSSSSPSSSAGASMTATPCSHGQSATPCAGSSESSSPREKRQFIMETPVLFINGLQSRDRHLFLFNDLLLIAKARSGGHFKLKDKVRISELWLATCVDEVAEGSAGKSRDTSFVIGWPPSVNLVATFNTAALRDLWWNRLGQAVKEERDKEPKATTIQITYHDAVQAIEYFKTLSVGPTETVRDVIKLALSHLEMSNTVDSNQFRLWLKTGSASPPLSSVDVGDSSPYPLIGHELPFAIKMNCLRDYISRTAAEGATENDNAAAAAAANGLDMLDHCNNIYSADPATRCQFILKSVQKPNFASGVLAGGAKQTVAAKGSGASGGKTKKSPTRIQKVFRRVQSKPDSIDTVGAGTGPSSLASMAPLGAIFAQPLSKICPQPDQLPQPVLDMLLELRAKGPHTVGIFRKSANARQVREIREHIDSATSRMDWSGVNAVVTAVVFKDFLRSLPDSLLCSSMYDQWLQVAAMDCHDGALEKIKGLCDRLPSANVTLLRHFLCVLVHITASSSHNMMSASNLAVCVGPSLLWAPQLTALPVASSSSSSALNSALALSAEATASKQVPALVAVLIDKCTHLFGADTLNLLNDKAPTAGVSPAIGEVQQQQQTQQLNNNRRVSLGSTPSGIGYSRTSKAPVQKHMARHGLMQHDSGNEESDSLHSLYHSDVMRRDDSSIDSLERELMNDEHHHHHHHHHHAHSTSMHHLRRDKMSVTNLSRDSGLTLSDTQLYTPDEDMEEGSESSSSGRGSDRDKSRVNGGSSASSAEMLLRPRTTTAPAAVVGSGSSSAASRSEQSRSMYAVPNISGIQSAPRLDAYGKLNAGPSSYTPVYNHRPEAIYRKLSDDVVYAVPKATPTVVLSEEFQSASSRFQRQDWFRRKSHNRKQSGGVKFDDSPPLGGGGPMRRSASDESLANVNSSSMQDGHYHHHHMHQHMHYQSNNKKPAAHRKGRAPPPPANGRMMMMDCMELSRRSKSDAHLDADALRLASQDETDRRSSVVNYAKHHHSGEQSYHNYHHNHIHHQQQHQHSSMRPSLSTPHISEDPSGSSSSTTLADRSYDSSTLSDDDSTPHVSRSNSRGSKDYRAVNSAWESAYGALTVPVPAPIHIIVSQDGTGSIVYPNGSTTTPNAKHPSSSRQMNGSSRSNATSTQQYNTPNSVGRSSHYGATPSSGGRYADYDTVIYSSNGRNRSRVEQCFDESPCTSLNSSKNGTPDIPSYEEAMLIRRQRQGGSAGSQATTPASASSTTWTTWKDKSSDRNLIQVRASPIRLNDQQKSADENRWYGNDNGVTSVHPSPSVPVKSDPIPPLPPKQKIHLRSNPVRLRLNNNNSTNINNNSSMSPSTRARPVTIHMDASILSSLDSSTSPQQAQQQAPALPRKERRGNNVSVVSIENSYTPLHRSFAFSTHNLRTAMMESAGREESSSTSSWTSRDDRDDDERKDQEIQTSGQWAQFCEIETQTSLSPQPSLTPSASSADDEVLTAPTSKRAPIVGRYEKNTVKSAARRREVAVETERSRARTREVSTGREHRSHSLPPLERSPLVSEDEAEDVESDEQERNESVKGKTTTTTTSTKLESSTSQTPRRAEISWSVSQLRALFNGNSPVSGSSSNTTTPPPPYRLPPTHQQPQRQRSESTDSYGEESYV